MTEQLDTTLERPEQDELAPYEATLQHIALIRSKINRLFEAQLEAERQLLHRIGRDWVAGRLSARAALDLHFRYQDTVCPKEEDGRRRYMPKRPRYDELWDEAVPVSFTDLYDLIYHAPNGPFGSWQGEYPLSHDSGPRPPNGQSVVYVLFDENNTPCYVGSTERFADRLRQHGRTKKFVRWVAYPCEDRGAAYALEVKLLAEHKPYLNRKVGA